VTFKPSAAALYWFIKSKGGEFEYTNQEDLAAQVKISYGTLKDAIKELRAAGELENIGKCVRLKSPKS